MNQTTFERYFTDRPDLAELAGLLGNWHQLTHYADGPGAEVVRIEFDGHSLKVVTA